MEFTKDSLMRALNKNFKFDISKDSIFGNVITVDAKTAYRFCLTTNSNYLIDRYGLNLFGKFKTFNHRNYSLNQGLFLIDHKTGTISDKNLPAKLYEMYPFIFKGDKKIIFIDGKNPSEIISSTFKKITKNNGNNEEYIVNVVHKQGSQWEHYFEFMASEFFIRKKYLTDLQLPWDYHGRPDFGIYKHPILKQLKSLGLIKNGALILELSSLKTFNSKYSPTSEKTDSYKSFVGEVKTKQNKSQILDYLKKGISNAGYEFIPNKQKSEIFSGLVNIDEDDKIQIQEAPQNEFLDKNKMKKDCEWFNNYLKLHLLGNLALFEIEELMEKIIKSNKLTFFNLIKLIKIIELSEILEVIENGL